MTGKIRSLFNARSAALKDRDLYKLQSLKAEIQREIRAAKISHAKYVAEEFKPNNTRSWQQLKKLLKINKQPAKECNVDSDILNDFYLRFEKVLPPPVLPPVESDRCPEIRVDEVIKCLRQTDPKKVAEDGGIFSESSSL